MRGSSSYTRPPDWFLSLSLLSKTHPGVSSLPSPPHLTAPSLHALNFGKECFWGGNWSKPHRLLLEGWMGGGARNLEVTWYQLIYINRCRRQSGEAWQIYRLRCALTLKDWLQTRLESIESNWRWRGWSDPCTCVTDFKNIYIVCVCVCVYKHLLVLFGPQWQRNPGRAPRTTSRCEHRTSHAFLK